MPRNYAQGGRAPAIAHIHAAVSTGRIRQRHASMRRAVANARRIDPASRDATPTMTGSRADQEFP
ncbi:hypothetical protein [Pseudoxanthomonas sp. LjRoot143]|uniref:hypothetical protein n=1 Tax=Pseudoxanthomonas sp. LjRoot143 TaxID=3342266 RepID=UPI003F4FCAF6